MNATQKLTPGDRIKLVAWATDASQHDEAEVVPPGTLGTVERMAGRGISDIMGQVAWVKFDNGQRLCVLEEDTFEVVDG